MSLSVPGIRPQKKSLDAQNGPRGKVLLSAQSPLRIGWILFWKIEGTECILPGPVCHKEQ